MVKTHERPDFKENSWYPMTKAAEMLGIYRGTLLEAAKRGRKNRGIDYKVGVNGRKKFLGKELLRFYDAM